MDGITAGTVTGVIGVLIWYLRYTTKESAKREKKHDDLQKEDRDFSRELITNTLKDIHSTGIKNAELNRKSIDMQKAFQKESVGTLRTICERLNGGTEGMRAIKRLKEMGNKDQRKVDKEVGVERRT